MTHRAAPIKAKFWTPGVVVLAVLMAAGAAAIAARFIGGIGGRFIMGGLLMPPFFGALQPLELPPLLGVS